MAQYNPNQQPAIPQGTPPSNPPQNPSQQPWITKGNIGGVAFDVEFNDSVLSTQGWNNPRYNGCKTITQILNQYTNGDATLGKTTAVQKYTRNFYIGRTVRFLDETDQTSPLVQFPEGAYVMLDGVATINSDNTLTNNNFQGAPPYVKTGFYRSFFDDFPVGKNISLKLLDSTVPENLNESYNVYYNQGRLIKQFTAENVEDLSFVDSSRVLLNNYGGGFFKYAQQSTGGGGADTGDLTSVFDVSLNTNELIKYTTASAIQTFETLTDVFSNILSYKAEDYTNRHFYVTPISGSNPYKFTDFDNNFTNRRAFNIFELSGTTHNTTKREMVINSQFGLSDDEYNGGSPRKGYIISAVNDSIPCLLIKIPDTDLPSGVGELPFIVMPHNLHPLIKDNIEYFAQRANINIPVNNNIRFNSRNTQLR